MNPLKQGLKLLGNRAFGGTGAMSLSMNPLKQGLKRHDIYDILANRSVFIHESIKTRVETQDYLPAAHSVSLSLSMNPLKQGLKPFCTIVIKSNFAVFIHESIKTRVETDSLTFLAKMTDSLYP